jgi:hypothetical protein
MIRRKMGTNMTPSKPAKWLPSGFILAVMLMLVLRTMSGRAVRQGGWR